MAAIQPSIECGRALETTDISHLQLWQDAVNARPNSLALISRHQKPGDFRWVGSQHTDTDYVQWSYADLDRGARRLATQLNRLTHIRRRPIATLVNTQAEWALFFWASAYLHSPLVPINPKVASRSEEIAHMLEMTQPAVVVCADSSIASQLEKSLSEKAMAGISVKIALAQSNEDKLANSWNVLDDIMSGEPTPPDTPDVVKADDTILVLFTSGTTSLPKPCNLSSFMCINAALGCMEARNINHNHRFVQHLPNFHSYGIGWSLGYWIVGGLLILPSANFEAQATLECFDLFQATHMSLVPTTAQAILAHPRFSKTNLGSLLSVDISGAGVLPSLVKACVESLKVPSYASYGMTESPGTLAWQDGRGSVVRDDEVYSGWPVRGTTVKVCDPDTREPVPRGTVGELHNGGPHVIHGYADPSVSSSNFYTDKDGKRWIITGDQAVMDHDGAVRISGRYKDMIIRGGENISPASIEDYLGKVLGVTGAQVVGVLDDMAGEVPIAVITTAEGYAVNASEIKDSTSRDLGTAFAPKSVLHLTHDLGLSAWPVTASGKVRKVDLRAAVRTFLQKQDAASAVDRSAPTVQSLITIWRKISGSESLEPSSLIDSFADSLMMMQLSGIVKKELGRDITVEDFKSCEKIQDQADLIDSRPERSTVPIKPAREGPPALKDMPYAQGNEAAYHRTKELVIANLANRNLTWDDVEDVVPMPDWDAIFCNRIRPSSWNLRFCYHAPVSAERLEKAVKESLVYHPTLRSLAVQSHDGETLLVSVRATKNWFRAALTSGWEVETKEELGKLHLNDPELDTASAPGPLVRIHIAKVRNDGTAGLVLVGSHATNDMSMTKLWLEDVMTIITGEGSLVPHALFRDYATAFSQHRDGAEATKGVDYWTSKLAGISATPESTLWPQQRAPEWFKGIDAGWSRWNHSLARSSERGVSMELKNQAQRGIRRITKVQDITRLKSEHGVPVFMLVKSAIALLNISQTGGKEAIFGTINAARTWPFSAGYSTAEREEYNGNPLDISGCTTEYVLDRVPVGPSQNVVEFMQAVTGDEENNSAFAHTPFYRIVDRLRDPLSPNDSRTFAERERDAESILSLIRRQSFNWLPQPPAAQNSKGLKLVEMLTRMDNGLTITGFLAEDKKSVALSFAWDAEHLSFREANTALDRLVGLVDLLGKEENWHLTVAELMRT